MLVLKLKGTMWNNVLKRSFIKHYSSKRSKCKLEIFSCLRAVSAMRMYLSELEEELSMYFLMPNLKRSFWYWRSASSSSLFRIVRIWQPSSSLTHSVFVNFMNWIPFYFFPFSQKKGTIEYFLCFLTVSSSRVEIISLTPVSIILISFTLSWLFTISVYSLILLNPLCPINFINTRYLI